MDAGVPIKAPVAGIAMGLVHADGQYDPDRHPRAEDAFGDMDFKVAGTADFVTALQLDTKIDGIPPTCWPLEQAKEARLQILDVMAGAIWTPRPEVNETAPKDHQRDPGRQDRGGHRRRAKVINRSRAERPALTSASTTMAWSGSSRSRRSTSVRSEAERQIKSPDPTAELGGHLSTARW